MTVIGIGIMQPSEIRPNFYPEILYNPCHE